MSLFLKSYFKMCESFLSQHLNVFCYLKKNLADLWYFRKFSKTLYNHLLVLGEFLIKVSWLAVWDPGWWDEVPSLALLNQSMAAGLKTTHGPPPINNRVTYQAYHCFNVYSGTVHTLYTVQQRVNNYIEGKATNIVFCWSFSWVLRIMETRFPVGVYTVASSN